MGLHAVVDEQSESVQRISTIARRSSCPLFIDILWPPTLSHLTLIDDPGVMFESSHRIVVFQQIGGQLRYYAGGGWCLDQSHICPEQDCVWAEGNEQGVFATVVDALAFTELYLVAKRGFSDIPVPRQVCWSRNPEVGGGV